MPKGQRIKPEQIVMLLRQVEVLTANGKTLAQACKEIGVGEQNYYRWRKMYGGCLLYTSDAADVYSV